MARFSPHNSPFGRSGFSSPAVRALHAPFSLRAQSRKMACPRPVLNIEELRVRMKTGNAALSSLRWGLALCASIACLGSSTSATMSAELPPEQVQAIGSWSKALAIDAATYCAPIVAMYNLRYSIAFAPTARAKPGEIWRFTNIATPTIAEQSGYVTPNVNVLYGFGFVDLRRGPVILSVPNSQGRYYMVEIVDMWTNAFAYAGGLETGYGGGKFTLVGPGWKGTLPPGVTRIDSPTPWVELQPRVFVKNSADIPAAKAVLDQITLTKLPQESAPSALSYNYQAPDLEPGIASSRLPFKDPLQFWTICSAAMNENPPPQAQIDSVLPQWKYLGLELGKQWTPQSPTNSIVLE
jgi:hypothetical protein